MFTTLLGDQISLSDHSFRYLFFSDLPTSLKTLVERLDNYLQSNVSMPSIVNPILSEETFTRHWDQEKYENFRDCIHRYREWIEDAYSEPDKDESIAKWQRIFGDEFAKGVVAERATFSEAFLLKTTQCSDIVTAALIKGSAFLEKFISPKLPHVERLPWRLQNRVTVTIRGSEYAERKGQQKLSTIYSGSVIDKNRSIKFEALQGNNLGLLFASKDFDVQWQVVNTDKEAVQANALRGDFYKSDGPGIRWESTSYRGAHWV